MSRDIGETDSEDTDSEHTWGGLGKFEYSRKGLPHALLHAPECVMRGGHHGASCTSVVEAGHKQFIKMASKFSWTRASRNETMENMLRA